MEGEGGGEGGERERGGCKILNYILQKFLEYDESQKVLMEFSKLLKYSTKIMKIKKV